MPRVISVRFVLFVLAAVVATSAVVAAVVGAQSQPLVPENLQAAIDSEPLIKVLDLPAESGGAVRSMFVQPTTAGLLCVWDAPNATSRARQGGCHPTDDPLGGNALSASLAYDGGPSIEGVKDARLIGLASIDTASVRVLMSDGTFRAIKLKKTKAGSDEFQAFGYRFKQSDLRKGIGPAAIVAFDASGAELGRQPTGIG